ncbi:MAG: TM0106 family RecB-like putative nuclease [Nitrospirae bacterium]|nr:MAG: TM0106 family RecB-like putative nuclease [Nitrospirota bacterium]
MPQNPIARTVTANDLYNLIKCPHRVYLDAHGNPAEKGEVGPFVTLLWERGLQTEREYVASLSAEHLIEDLSDLAAGQAFPETIRAMQAGAPVIYQGCLIDGPFVGRPDLLVKHEEGTSSFGPYLYEPIDIKAGRGWEPGEGRTARFKAHYAVQIMFYRMLLERIQGSLPPMARIVNVDNQLETFDPSSFEDTFQRALSQAQRLVAGEECSEPVLGSQCFLCAWVQHCQRWVKDHDDPTGLFSIGRQKFRLKEVGLRTIHDIAQMDITTYLRPEKKIPRMSEKTLRRMKLRANVVLSGEPLIRPGYTFPQTEREIYFDIEDDPTRGVTYLFGLLIVEKHGPPRYTYFLARHPKEEEAAVRAFWAFLAEGRDETYYVYSHKERSTLKQLRDRYGLDPALFDRYVSREFDLYSKLIVEYSDWPTFSYSLKHIAKRIGFYWRDPDPSGAHSIAWYNTYLEDPANEDALQRILLYNEDDCRAMRAVKLFFQHQAQYDSDQGQALDRQGSLPFTGSDTVLCPTKR